MSAAPPPSAGGAPEPYRPATPAEVALAATADALNEEHPLNARLRDQGAGLVPRVLQVDLDARSATLGAAAIKCTFDVPLGWHVSDNARRTLVFDAEGTTQVSLNLRTLPSAPPAGVTPVLALLQSIEREHTAQQPDLQVHYLDQQNEHVLVFMNLRVGNETLGQAYWPRVVRPDLFLTARITAPPPPSDLLPRALNLAEVILRSAKYMGG